MLVERGTEATWEVGVGTLGVSWAPDPGAETVVPRTGTEADPDPAMGERILERAIKLVPGLANGKGRAGLDVIRHGVGLRPVRKGGYRVDRETRQGWSIVHNYGHGVRVHFCDCCTRDYLLTGYLMCRAPAINVAMVALERQSSW